MRIGFGNLEEQLVQDWEMPAENVCGRLSDEKGSRKDMLIMDAWCAGLFGLGVQFLNHDILLPPSLPSPPPRLLSATTASTWFFRQRGRYHGIRLGLEVAACLHSDEAVEVAVRYPDE